MLGKILSEKTAKNVFYIQTNIVTKKWGGGKKARNNFSRNTIVRAKNDGGKNRRKKVRKTFLYIHTNSAS